MTTGGEMIPVSSVFGSCPRCSRPLLPLSSTTHATPFEALCLVCDEKVPEVDFDRWWTSPEDREARDARA